MILELAACRQRAAVDLVCGVVAVCSGGLVCPQVMLRCMMSHDEHTQILRTVVGHQQLGLHAFAAEQL